MQKILVSACLLGDPVRYNGAHKRSDDGVLQRWIAEGRVVSVCPEVAGGLGVPRKPAEIERGADGPVRVMDSSGRDVTMNFVRGAEEAAEVARIHGIRIAILKEGSPSCGTGFVYDGTFSGTRVAGLGVAAARLRDMGVSVFSENQIAEAAALLSRMEST